MTRAFLINFMQAAKSVSSAERCLVVDRELEVIDYDNIDEDTLYSKDFQNVVVASIQEALKNDDVVLTNNRITDPAQAPTTNTNYTDLRVVVALPIGKIGALYMDQHIRVGIMPKPMIDRLANLANHLIDNNLLDASVDEIKSLYKEQGETTE